MENNYTENDASSGCANICASDIDEETAKRLRGDAIGETLYSQTFAIKTLMRFSNIEWNEQFEEDLCFLWDMTLEKDVCEFLFSLSYPTLACNAVSTCSENRFVEIVVGILANIFCADCKKSIEKEEVDVIMNLIYNEDWLILIQVVRFITAYSSDVEDASFLTSALERICFILQNSLNEDLLTKTLETVAKVTSDSKLPVGCIESALVASCFDAYDTLVSKKGLTEPTPVKYIIQFMCNLGSYATNFESEPLLSSIRNNNSRSIKTIEQILHHYSREKYLFPLTDAFDFFIDGISYVVIALSADYSSNMFISIFKIVNLILKSDMPVIKSFLEIMTYLIFRSKGDKIKNDLKVFKTRDVKRVFDYIDNQEYDGEYPYKDNYSELKVYFT